MWLLGLRNKLLGQESGRTKVSRIFRIFVPNFAPNFAPNFPRIFRGLFVLRFVGDGDQKKFTKNPRHFSMQNSQANTKKIFTKLFWRAGKVTNSLNPCHLQRTLVRLSPISPGISRISMSEWRCGCGILPNLSVSNRCNFENAEALRFFCAPSFSGKVNFCTGTGRKAFFEFFSA